MTKTKKLKIALINEDSQADQNELIYTTLKTVSKKYNHSVFNYGMFKSDSEHWINWTDIGLMAAILIESEACDFVVTGCGTGQGAMMSCNSFSNLLCGYVKNPIDAYLFSHINAGNCVSIPYAQEFGWSSELILKDIFENLFSTDSGKGYPKKYIEDEKKSRVRFTEMIKINAGKSVIDVLKSIDKDYLLELINYDEFKELFFKNANKEKKITNYVFELLKDNGGIK